MNMASARANIGRSTTGNLTRQEASLLIEQGNLRKRAVGFKKISDKATGISVGIPEKLISSRAATKWGTNLGSEDDRINIDTLRFTGITLSDLFDKLTKFRNRQVTYSAFKDDWFVISGLDRDGSEVYIRAEKQNSEIRGYSVRIDKEWRNEYHSIPIAMSSSFRMAESPIVEAGEPGRASTTNERILPPPPHPTLRPNPIPAECFNGLGCGIVAFTAR